MSSIDPYKVLGIPPTANLEEIRNAFRQLVLVHHPDRGGIPSDFDLIKQSYNAVYKLLKKNESYQKRQNMTKMQYQHSRNSSDDILFQQKNLFAKGKMNSKIFNRVFSKNKVELPSQQGYGDFMVKSSSSREEIDILKKQKLNKKKHQIVKFKEPEAVSQLSQNYEIIGDDGNNFSNRHQNRNMNFTDYMEAHDDEEVGQKLDYDRKEYNNMDDLIQDRSNIRYKMNSQEEREQQNHKEQLERIEQNRRMRAQKQEEMQNRAFMRINHRIGYN